jgi:hypothetical protein
MHPLSEEEATAPSAWPSLKRALGYVVSAIFASLFYVAWIFWELLRLGRDAHEHFIGTFCASIFFLLFGGFGLVFVPLILPWALAVGAFPRARVSGRVYFTLAGAILIFVIGCVMSSLTPKPLFIEDQTFFEGVLIAVKTGRHLFCN